MAELGCECRQSGFWVRALKLCIMLHFKEWDRGWRSTSVRSLDLFKLMHSQLMPSGAGRCQYENVKIIFKLLQWRRGKTILGEPWGLATSLLFLPATLSLKSSVLCWCLLLRQTFIHLTNIYSSLATSALVLGAQDVDVKTTVPALELRVCGTAVDVHQVTFSRT